MSKIKKHRCYITRVCIVTNGVSEERSVLKILASFPDSQPIDGNLGGRLGTNTNFCV